MIGAVEIVSGRVRDRNDEGPRAPPNNLETCFGHSTPCIARHIAREKSQCRRLTSRPLTDQAAHDRKTDAHPLLSRIRRTLGRPKVSLQAASLARPGDIPIVAVVSPAPGFKRRSPRARLGTTDSAPTASRATHSPRSPLSQECARDRQAARRDGGSAARSQTGLTHPTRDVPRFCTHELDVWHSDIGKRLPACPGGALCRSLVGPTCNLPKCQSDAAASSHERSSASSDMKRRGDG